MWQLSRLFIIVKSGFKGGVVKVLVTGITGFTGFIGGHLESLLHSNDFDVSAVVRSKNNSPNDRTQVHLIDDIRTCDFDNITKGFDVVIHLAALVHQPTQKDFKSYKVMNTDVSIKLALACVRNNVSKLVVLSTCAVYSGKKNDAFSERDIVMPNSPYGMSKLNATKKIMALLKHTDTSYYILRPNLVYGKNGKGNYKTLVNLIYRLSSTPFSQATYKRSYVSVHNLCDFILYLINHNVESGIYNVSDNHDLSTKELCELIAKAQNKKIIQIPVPKWVMKMTFQAIGRKDHYEKIYGEFRLNVDKALATGWTPKEIDHRDFIL